VDTTASAPRSREFPCHDNAALPTADVLFDGPLTTEPADMPLFVAVSLKTPFIAFRRRSIASISDIL